MLTAHQRLALRRRFPTAEVGDRGGRPIVVIAVPGEGFVYATFLLGGWVASPNTMDHQAPELVRAARELQELLSH